MCSRDRLEEKIMQLRLDISDEVLHESFGKESNKVILNFLSTFPFGFCSAEKNLLRWIFTFSRLNINEVL